MERPVAWCIRHVPFEGPAQLGPLLESRGFDVRPVALHRRDTLPVVGDDDVVVLTGGPMSVNDESIAWMSEERDWVAARIAAGCRLLGVCLGSQILARVLGAEVRPMPHREVGWFAVRAHDDGPLARVLSSPSVALHWHGERWELPGGARLLAGSEACDHQAFAYGDHVLALQMHLEMTEESAAALCRHCPEDLAPGPWVQDEATVLAAGNPWRRAHAALAEVVDLWLERELR